MPRRARERPTADPHTRTRRARRRRCAERTRAIARARTRAKDRDRPRARRRRGGVATSDADARRATRVTSPARGVERAGRARDDGREARTARVDAGIFCAARARGDDDGRSRAREKRRAKSDARKANPVTHVARVRNTDGARDAARVRCRACGIDEDEVYVFLFARRTMRARGEARARGDERSRAIETNGIPLFDKVEWMKPRSARERGERKTDEDANSCERA